jgi:acyl-CoA thioesterase-2
MSDAAPPDEPSTEAASPAPSPTEFGTPQEVSVLRQLVRMLDLEQIEHLIFRGQSQDLGWGQVFGGQVLGQALSAAAKTVPADRVVHSLHAYFLRPGDVAAPIVYIVDPIRDGRSFHTRRVVAQQHGKAIFNLSASFHVDEQGPSHQSPMPTAPGPETLVSERDLAQRVAHKLPDGLRRRVTAPWPIEIRPVAPVNAINPAPREPVRKVWFRTAAALPDDPAVHRYLLAYASDFHFLATALQPHGVGVFSREMRLASIDHAMWFHRPFRMDEWLLYSIVSPSASDARGLVQGRFFTADGTLVASTCQEGLMRRRPPRKEAGEG